MNTYASPTVAVVIADATGVDESKYNTVADAFVADKDTFAADADAIVADADAYVADAAVVVYVVVADAVVADAVLVVTAFVAVAAAADVATDAEPEVDTSPALAGDWCVPLRFITLTHDTSHVGFAPQLSIKKKCIGKGSTTHPKLMCTKKSIIPF